MTSGSARPANVIITRSREGNEELASRLRLAGLNPIPVAAISIAPPHDWTAVDSRLMLLGTFDWLVLTSAAGVKYFGIRMRTLSLRLPWVGKPRVAAVGQQTAGALSNLGVEPAFVPSRFTTSVLGEELPAERGSRILLLRADVADSRLADRLDQRGFKVEETPIYRTSTGSGVGPKIAEADLIVFASPSAVRGFCSLVPKEELVRLTRLRAVCIGPVTESAARGSGFVNTSKPESYTLEAVVREVKRVSNGNA